MKLRLGIIAAFLMLLGFSQVRAERFADETLRYVVTYKWGLIHKDAGDATVTLRNSGGNYRITLTAKTKPWADHVFRMRDTLVSVIKADGLRPVSYLKVSHEDGAFSRDEITYSYHDNVVLGAAKRHKIRKNGTETHSTKTLSASGRAYDFLSVFYYLRTLDFNSLRQGAPVKVSVFSGKMVETLTIKYVGKETVKMRNGTRREAYKIRFRFTGEGGRTSSDDIEAWISTDAAHVPLQLVGSLPVGQIRVYLL